MSVDKTLPAAALVLVAIGAALGLSSTLALLHSNWTSLYGPDAHGYLVLAASVWLTVTAWQASPPPSLRPDWWAALPLGALLVLLVALELMFVNNFRLLLLPPLALAAVAFVFGREAAKRLFWSALFLYFALPQWWVINGFLQTLTTAAVSALLQWSQVPAFVQGNFVQLPSGTFEIASGCSGLNYLQAGTALAAFHGLLSFSTWRNRLVLLATAAGVAIVFNWIRVYAVVVTGYVSEMQHYLITGEHHTFGWVLFTVAMVPIVLFASRLERRDVHADATTGSGTGAHALPIASRPVILAAFAAATSLLLPLAATQPAAALGSATPTALPATLGDGETRAALTSGWSPVFANAMEDSGVFSGASPPVEVYRAVYPEQDSKHRLLRPANDFLGAGFQLLEQPQLDSVTLPDGHALDLMEYRGTLQQRPRIVWAWYWVGGTQVAGGLGSRLADLSGSLRGRRDGVATAVAADCVPDCSAAKARLASFVARHEPTLRWPPERR